MSSMRKSRSISSERKNLNTSQSPSKSKANSSFKKTKSRSSIDSDLDETHVSKKSNKNRSPSKKQSPQKRSIKNASKSPLKLNHAETEDLRNQGIAILPPFIFEKTRLKELYISENNLQSLPPSIKDLVNLEILDVSKNPLKVKDSDDVTCFPIEMRFLKNLKYLNISECNLRYIPSVIWLIVSIENLNISRNKITMLISEVGNLGNLKKLNLTQCDIATLPAEIGFCENLEEILLFGNEIENLPETLKECHKLRELKLNYHSFHALLDGYMADLIREGKIKSEHIPMVIFELENLELLDLSATKINNFPENSLNSLIELRLDKNFFDRIPETILEGKIASNLKILTISRNRLVSIPSGISALVNLSVLNLSGNTIISFPDSIQFNLPNLNELYLSHNGLNQLTNDIVQLKSLKRLALDHNRLVTLPNELYELTKLEYLNLSHNNLTKLSHKITKLTNLKAAHVYEKFIKNGLWLTNNPLENPPKDVWITNDINKIYTYLETHFKRNVNYCYFSKLIFIGETNVGKSCMVDCLVNPVNIKNFITRKNDSNNPVGQMRQSITKNFISTPLESRQMQNSRLQANDIQITPLSNRQSTNLIQENPTQNSSTTRLLRKFYLRTIDKIDFGIFDLGGDPCYHYLYPHLLASIDHSTQPTIFVIVYSHSEYTCATHERLIGMWLKYILLYSTNSGVPIKVKLLGIKSDTDLDENNQDILKTIIDNCNHTLNLNKILLNKEKFRLEERLKQIDNIDRENYQSISHTIARLNKEIDKKIQIIDEITLIESNTIRDDLAKLLKNLQNETIQANKKVPLNLRDQIKKFVLNHDKSKYKLNKESIIKLIDTNRDLILDAYDLTDDEILDYLCTIGDLLWFKNIPQLNDFIFNRVGFLIESLQLIVRHDFDLKLDYNKNLVFKKIGLYRSQDDFEIDLRLLKKYGIFVNKILEGLMFENESKKQSKEHLFDLLQDLIIIYKCSTEFDDRNLPVQKIVYPNLVTARFDENNHESSITSEFDRLIPDKEENYFIELDKYREYVNIVKLIKAERKEQEIWNLNQFNSYDTVDEEETKTRNELLRRSLSSKLRESINILNEELDENEKEQETQDEYLDKDEEFLINSIENEFKHIKSYHDVKLDMKKYTYTCGACLEYTFLIDFDTNIFNKLSILIQEIVYERLDSSECIIARDNKNNFIKIENYYQSNQSNNKIKIEIKCTCKEERDDLCLKFNRFFEIIFSFYPGIIYLKKIELF